MSKIKQIQANELVRRVRDKFRISKVVCTRSVKSPTGEVYVGMSGGCVFESSQESVEDEGPTDPLDPHNEGLLSFHEAKIAALVLGMQVDTLALERASATGVTWPEQAAQDLRATQNNYATLILNYLGDEDDG